MIAGHGHSPEQQISLTIYFDATRPNHISCARLHSLHERVQSPGQQQYNTPAKRANTTPQILQPHPLITVHPTFETFIPSLFRARTSRSHVLVAIISWGKPPTRHESRVPEFVKQESVIPSLRCSWSRVWAQTFHSDGSAGGAVW